MVEIIRAAWDFAGRNAAAMIALCALVFTAYQLALTRRHNRLSVRPRLTSQTNRISGPDARITYSVINSGIGPAIIESFAVTFDGAPVNLQAASDVDAALTRVLGQRPRSFAVGHLGSDATMRKDEERVLLDLRFPALTPVEFEGIEGRLGRARVVIKYRSLYDEPFVFDSEQNR